MSKLHNIVLIEYLCVGATMLILALCVIPMSAYASIASPQYERGDDEVSVTLPVANENASPFDFYIDPEGLIYKSGNTEYESHLLFRNVNAEYMFSSSSDMLELANQSDIPLQITVTAAVYDLGEISMNSDTDFSGADGCSMYLALTDDRGNEVPIMEDGEASIVFEMLGAEDEVCLFGLTGACNTTDEWGEISVHPQVKVTWSIELLDYENEVLEADIVSDNAADVSANEADSVSDSDSDTVSEDKAEQSDSASADKAEKSDSASADKAEKSDSASADKVEKSDSASADKVEKSDSTSVEDAEKSESASEIETDKESQSSDNTTEENKDKASEYTKPDSSDNTDNTDNTDTEAPVETESTDKGNDNDSSSENPDTNSEVSKEDKYIE